ncbi:MAG TPA: hypothetical protein VFH21_07420 [Burkholderiales bacterium]|nr:hypothetical protein [Burkholderiales bacterium]
MSSRYVTGSVYTGVERRVMAKRISWGAIFAGVIIAMAVQFLLSLLGTGIGMSTVDPAQGDTPSAGAFGIGAGIWWTVSSLIALFIGGWAAGHLAGNPLKKDGALHGFLTWALSTLVMLYLISSAVGTVVGGAFNMIGTTVTAATPQVAETAANRLESSNLSWDKIKSEAMQMLSRGQASGSAQNQQFEDTLGRLLKGGQPTQADREAAINALMTEGGMTREEAQSTVQNWEQQYRQTRQDVKQTTEVAADTVATSSLMGFFALLLGAAAAAWGGATGSPRRVIETVA